MCGSKHSTSTSTVTIPADVLARYNAVNARAESAAAKPFQSFGTQASDYVAQINPQQTAGIAGINQAAGSYQPYMTSAVDATKTGMGAANLGDLDINKYLSPYLSQVQGSTAALMNQANEQAQSGALGSAISSGAFGGDRAGIAAANLNQQNQLAMGKTMADIANQGYTLASGIAQGQQAADLEARQANLARQMAGGAQLAGLGAQEQALGLQGAQAQIGAGTLQQQTEQAGKNAMIDRFMQEQGYPFQVAQFLANIAMGTGALSGTTTTSKQPVGFFGNLATGGRVEAYADGGVAGPRTHIKEGIGGDGYVPSADLPVGQLMIAPFDNSQGGGGGGGLGDIVKIASMFTGKAYGGAADGRHGYATDGAVSYDPLDEDTLRKAVGNRHFLHPDQYSGAPDAATMATPTNPANMGLPGHMTDMPQGLGAAAQTGPRTITLPDTSAPAQGFDAVPAIPSPPSSMRPQPRPTGLAGADVARDAMAAIGQPGLAPANTAAKPTQGTQSGLVPQVQDGDQAARDFYRSRIIHQESGGRQFDRNGNPLTSSAGAVGVGQIMEGTGPEAAKLAGLPWDRDRWLNDPAYNAAIGEAYFLEQYRKFGSIDKAAAAYNAGPGRVASAMDRASALGGTWQDYLPEETKNYIAATTGSGGSAGGVGSANLSAMSGAGSGLGAAQGKPYEERNAIGKFFHNPDGRLNTDALLSVLSGLGAMASSRSMSPLTAILQGVGAGAGTYADLREKAPARIAQNLENTAAARRMYAMAREMGETRPFEEWVKTLPEAGTASLAGQTATGVAGAPGTASAAPATAAQSYMGAPIDIFGSGMNTPITVKDATGQDRTIPAGMDYGYLTQLENYLKSKAALGIPGTAEKLAAVQDQLKKIADNNGFVTAPDGSSFLLKSYADIQNQNVSRATKIELGNQIIQELPERKNELAVQSGSLDRMAGAFSTIANSGTSFGPGTQVFKDIRSLASQLGIPFDENTTDAMGAIDIIAKELGKTIMAEGGTLTDNARRYLEASEPNVTMRPGAIAEILAVKKAMLDREKNTLGMIEKAGADPAGIYDANLAGRSTPVDWEKYLPEYQRMMQSPDASASASSAPSLPKPKSEAERNALPPGTRYEAPDGSVRIR